MLELGVFGCTRVSGPCKIIQEATKSTTFNVYNIQRHIDCGKGLAGGCLMLIGQRISDRKAHNESVIVSGLHHCTSPKDANPDCCTVSLRSKIDQCFTWNVGRAYFASRKKNMFERLAPEIQHWEKHTRAQKKYVGYRAIYLNFDWDDVRRHDNPVRKPPKMRSRCPEKYGK